MKYEIIGNKIIFYNTNQKGNYPHTVYEKRFCSDEYISHLKEKEKAKQNRKKERERRK